ncbi:uncharacterized protein LOC115690263 isoform X1 [Syzygium oleosum]|uniref:uncharacterized protein LOC115690263 isoform X1 n=1 Tax=Syzygium oleosum TaxID=219896 RepID=UPI0011D2C320|nr:uncharacterized protein LOC115690263 isoform X1 [Syzygium oleosum]XP_056170620.1 uncharacterized protein LOC115690263 isoform X1 [Syzygium oleosum]
MGCLVSTPEDNGGMRRMPRDIGEVSVYVPGLRIPKPVNFSPPLGSNLSWNLVQLLTTLRNRIAVLAGEGVPTVKTSTRKNATQHGGSTLTDLQYALEEYLPVLLGLVKEGNHLMHKVQFVWVNQEDEAEETAISNAWYEVLSVLHMMAIVSLLQANIMLLPKTSADGIQSKVSEGCRRASVDVFLKAAGFLDYAVRHVLPQFPAELRRELPVDLQDGVLQALCLQALGQAADIQLGMAIASSKATLAVKRRLACETVKYWQQAQENLVNLPLVNGWGEKHHQYVKWKYVEAKAAAYYFHGLILDEGKSHGMAAAALQVAVESLEESKKLSAAFDATPPLSRNPPVWGTAKYISEKIPNDASAKVRINRDLYSQDKTTDIAPTLPDFALALKPDDYQLPSVHSCWNQEKTNSGKPEANQPKDTR